MRWSETTVTFTTRAVSALLTVMTNQNTAARAMNKRASGRSMDFILDIKKPASRAGLKILFLCFLVLSTKLFTHSAFLDFESAVFTFDDQEIVTNL
jgi:hypothetical protein